MAGRGVRIIIECPERILHLEAGYIYADCPFINFNPLAVRRRTIHFRPYVLCEGLLVSACKYLGIVTCVTDRQLLLG